MDNLEEMDQGWRGLERAGMAQCAPKLNEELARQVAERQTGAMKKLANEAQGRDDRLRDAAQCLKAGKVR